MALCGNSDAIETKSGAVVSLAYTDAGYVNKNNAGSKLIL